MVFRLSVRSRALLLAVFSALTVLGCSSGGDADPDGNAAADVTAEYLALRAELISLTQEGVTQCMAQLGWDLPPLPFAQPIEDQPALVAGGWVEPSVETGYGVAAGLESGSEPDAGASVLDLVDQYRESLSDSEKTAFDRDLYGSEGGPGCEDSTSVDTTEFEEFSRLATRIELAEARITADPAMVESWGHWTACVEEATGLLAKNQDDLLLQVVSRAQLVVPTDESIDEDSASEMDGPVDSDNEATSLIEFAQFERELAEADTECYGQHVEENYDRVAGQVYESID